MQLGRPASAKLAVPLASIFDRLGDGRANRRRPFGADHGVGYGQPGGVERRQAAKDGGQLLRLARKPRGGIAAKVERQLIDRDLTDLADPGAVDGQVELQALDLVDGEAARAGQRGGAQLMGADLDLDRGQRGGRGILGEWARADRGAPCRAFRSRSGRARSRGPLARANGATPVFKRHPIGALDADLLEAANAEVAGRGARRLRGRGEGEEGDEEGPDAHGHLYPPLMVKAGLRADDRARPGLA